MGTNRVSLRAGAAFITVAATVVPQGVNAQQQWRLHEELRIGALDGPNAITRVGSVLPDQDGRLVYVTQSREQTIRVFDATTGHHERTIGRSGAGPGEFQRIGPLSWRGDSLFAADPYQQRMSVFNREGEHLQTFRTVATALPDGHRPPLPRKITPLGTVWAQPAPNMMSVSRGLVAELPIVILSREGQILHRITTLPLTGSMTTVEFDGGVVVFLQPLRNPHQRMAIADDGSGIAVVSFDTDQPRVGTFSVARVSPEGDTIFRRTYRYTPVLISAQQRDSIISEGANTIFRRAGSKARALSREHLNLPDTQPPVSRVLVDARGRTWLRREELRSPVRWIALSPDGTVEGFMDITEDVTLQHISGDTAWGVVQDDLEVPYVVKYRLVPDR